MKLLIIVIGLIMLAACSSTPNRCNQKSAQASQFEINNLDKPIYRT